MPTVLVVDDEADVTELIETTLERAGVDIVLARNGEEAVDLALMLQPELVLLDLEMPRMNGIEACRRMRNEPKLRGTRVVVVTALVDAAGRAIEAGADRVLAKPFSPLELMHLVDAIDPELSWKPT